MPLTVKGTFQAKYERVHRVQRVPVTESGEDHTSTATVAIMLKPMKLILSLIYLNANLMYLDPQVMVDKV